MAIPYEKLRVLIVEDHKFTRHLMKEVLQNLGCQQGNIYEAEDGTAGLQLQRENEVDLVVCDWQMKPMDGLSLVRKLRDPEVSRNPFVPIILCSAHTDRDLVQRAVDLGINEIMTKPISVRALESRIQAIYQQPRPFVDSAQYFGPDRRRRDGNLPQGAERRRARRTVIKQVGDDEPFRKHASEEKTTETGEG